MFLKNENSRRVVMSRSVCMGLYFAVLTMDRIVVHLICFREQKSSCELFCQDQDCYIFTKAEEDFRKDGRPNQPVCPTHKTLAKLRTVKDKMKQTTAVRTSYALTEKIPANFSSGVMYMKILET